MKIERFEIAGLAQYSYVISDKDDAAVIDPMRDIERYTGYAATHGLRVVRDGTRDFSMWDGATFLLSGSSR